MRKILYVIDQPNLYGSERHLLDTIKFQQTNYDISVIAFREGPLIELIEELGIKVYVIYQLGWIPSQQALRYFEQIIKEVTPDIIHSHQPKANFWSTWMARKTGCLHIATLHTMPIQAALVHPFPIKQIVRVFHRLIIEYVKILSTHCIYVSRTAMNLLSSHKQHESYIYNWVSPDRNKNTQLHKGTINYICIGSISKSKGTKELVDWFEWIAKKNSIARLTIVGNGSESYLKYIRDYIRNKNLENRIKMLGYSDNIIQLLRENDIFISATQSESFGLVFIEAMIQGLPIITRQIAVLEELIPQGNLFIKNDQISESDFNAFIKRVKSGSVSKANAYWTHTNFNYDRQQQKISELYESLFRYS